MSKLIILLLAFQFFQSPIAMSQIKGYKYNTVKLVLDKVAAAYGTNVKQPKIEILGYNSSRKVAVMYYPGDRPIIAIDEEVYDLCSRFGKDSLNALASLLGHELAHHFNKHDWCSNFAFMMGKKDELALKLKKESKESKEFIESQADYWGGFYGYVAGFATYEITPKLLDAIYAYYKCPEKIEGYPTKSERKLIAEKRKAELQNWIAVFDASEFLFAIKDFQKAAICLDYLIEKFPSRELFNNSGVCKLMMALDYFDPKEFSFLLPIEFDTKTRLKNSSVRGIGIDPIEKVRQRNLWLDEAILLFDKATQTDPDYLNGKINKACAFVLKSNNDMALGIANEILGTTKYENDKYSLSKAYTLKGVASYRNKNTVEAKTSFETAYSLYKYSNTKFNLGAAKELDKGLWDSFADYLNGFFDNEESNFTNIEKNFNPTLEMVDEVNPLGVVISEEWKTLLITGNPLARLNYYTNEKVGRFVISQKNEVAKFISTKSGYSLKSAQGIGIGEHAEVVKLKYGEPAYKLNVVKGEYWIYKKSRIAFLVNERNCVERWFLYCRD